MRTSASFAEVDIAIPRIIPRCTVPVKGTRRVGGAFPALKSCLIKNLEDTGRRSCANVIATVAVR